MLKLFHQQNCDCCELDRYSGEAIALSPHSTDKLRRLGIALALISGFAIAEVAVGWFSHSLALVAESVHMVSDCIALGIALLAAWLGQRAANDHQGTRPAVMGQNRVELWAALGNGVGLLLIALWIVRESITHLQSPPEHILSAPMLMTAIAGFGVNTLNASLLHSHSHEDLNLRGAFLHMVADAASSVGVILAAIAVSVWNWTWADSVTSLGVAVLIVVGSVPLIYQSVQVLIAQTALRRRVELLESSIQLLDGVVAVAITQTNGGSAKVDAVPTFSIQTITDGVDADGRDRLRQQILALLPTQVDQAVWTIEVSSPPPRPEVNLSSPPTLEILCSQDS